MILESFAAGPLGCNCTLVVDETTKQALVVDPGGDLAEIERRLARHGATTRAIVHTHTHIDHVGATAELQRRSDAAARIHQGDQFLYSILPIQAAMLGLGSPPEQAELDTFLADDEVIKIGSLDVHVIHTPGHTPGSCCFEISTPDATLLLAGDTLFQRGVGRTDLWGGDHDALIASIKNRLFALPDPTRVICGHGPDTTVGAEKRSNPFVR